MPLFSVIVPVYNVHEYIEECINSVLSQDFGDFELILIDDYSNDGSYEICVQYELRDPRIKVVRNKENMGVSRARNEGMNIASGQYWTFLDSDDYWSANILSDIRYIISNHDGIELIRGRYLIEITGSNRPMQASYDFTLKFGNDEFTGRDFLNSMLHMHKTDVVCWVYFFSAHLYRKHFLMFLEGVIGEDAEWLPRLLMNVNRMICIEKSYCVHRVNRNGSYMNSSNLAKLQVKSGLLVFSHLSASDCSDPLLQEYYLRIFSSFLYAAGFLSRKSRRKIYRMLPLIHDKVLVYSESGYLIRAFILIFGEVKYAYPFHLLYRIWTRIRKSVYALIYRDGRSGR